MSGKRFKNASEMISHLRKEFDLPEEKVDAEEEARIKRETEARRKRMEAAGTEENYVKMFNRDPWTDQWLGSGPEPPMPFLEDNAKKVNKAIRERTERESEEWRSKYMKPVKSVALPKIKESKAVRKARKKRKKQEDRAVRQEKYEVAYWFLEEFLKPKYAQEIYFEYADRFEEMVDYCYWFATQWVSELTYDKKDRFISKDDIGYVMDYHQKERDETVCDVGGMKFKRLEEAERYRRHYDIDIRSNQIPDIPDEYWNEFDKWCKSNPIKKFKKKAKNIGWGISPVALRRASFLKKINKRNKGFRKNMMLHDPITGASFVSEKKMKETIRKRLNQYDKQRAEFIKLLDKMVDDGKISEDMAINWMEDTKEARDRVKKRYKGMEERVAYARKEAKKVEAHEKKLKAARKDWYKRFGDDIDKPYKLEIDGEEVTIKKISERLYSMDRKNSTHYAESMKSLLLD